MELVVEPAVIQKIQAKKQPQDLILLDNEDGEGPFVDYMVSCQLYGGFRLLLVDPALTKEVLAVYSIRFETAAGPILMKPSGNLFLDTCNRLLVEPTYQRIQLKSDSGIIASTVELSRKK